MNSDELPAAQWYSDPEDQASLRYWDGSQWTDQRMPLTATPVAGPDNGVRGFREIPAESRGGLFGSKKAMRLELERLRSIVDGFGYGERASLEAELDHLRSERAELASAVAATRRELSELQQQLVKSSDELVLQEVGVYEYRHRLEDAVAYKERLDSLRLKIKAASGRGGGAINASTDWQVNGSKVQGRKMVNETSKLLLRAYNGEADVLVNKLRPYKLDAAVDRLNKSRAVIGRLGATMSINIAEDYHRLRVQELVLTADFIARKEEEKEADRAERARMQEEARARREFETEKARLLKEHAHYVNLRVRHLANGDSDAVASCDVHLAELDKAIHDVEAREANIRAGYVYVISNVGSFGPDVVKIGMTRRLEPYVRVRELGDASVPFRYDLHALVFSQDAVSLESRLHQAFEERRVNLVNSRREFFYVSPAEVETVLRTEDASLLEYVTEPVAEEWHQSENTRRKRTSLAVPRSSTTLPTPSVTGMLPPPVTAQALVSPLPPPGFD